MINTIHRWWDNSRLGRLKPRYLPHTWVDRDTLLENVMFEGHEGRLVIDIIKELYHWWTVTWNVEYPKKERELLDEFAKFIPEELFIDSGEGYLTMAPMLDGSHEAYMDFEKHCEAEMIVKMKLLCDIHNYMWT